MIGPAKQKMQYQQRDGNKETITVMVTICADGSTILPTCIYKGQTFSTNWHQDNTLQASVAYSNKGWTDGTIGWLWIKDFDQKTHNKANGHACLLLVDGHNSHYTKEFLDYAKEHNIHVLCYPAHTTHIYQGLDVVIFSPLKKCWSEEQDQFKSSTGQRITKQTFISIYGKAHQKVLTPDLVHTAFTKTGVWPFNPNIMTKEMMAPSLATLSQGCLPLQQPSPVHAISSLLCQYQKFEGAHHTPAAPFLLHQEENT
ncbi:hypothetical protein PISMIDRAFT_106027 [Pisolithus microcarpus 441]|uniref:Unplaced genomic scaffold scaffold_83, whole genome shotgun sequence n=1 Tax=Pisolithus microcarpus 441 TaxID=765257 RepID=A0A0C9Y6L5_9AGAM|nr:hypothetical protein PISMIDRAFT_106027 [Pisolithus microcarpus 441]